MPRQATVLPATELTHLRHLSFGTMDRRLLIRRMPRIVSCFAESDKGVAFELRKKIKATPDPDRSSKEMDHVRPRRYRS